MSEFNWETYDHRQKTRGDLAAVSGLPVESFKGFSERQIECVFQLIHQYGIANLNQATAAEIMRRAGSGPKFLLRMKELGWVNPSTVGRERRPLSEYDRVHLHRGDLVVCNRKPVERLPDNEWSVPRRIWVTCESCKRAPKFINRPAIKERIAHLQARIDLLKSQQTKLRKILAR